MSKDNYNFDEAAQEDSPTIIMGGQNYKLRYPTVEEIEGLQKLKTDEERADAIYGFVEKTSPDQPDFKDVLQKQSIRVLKAFTAMIKTEFGVE